MESRKTMRSVSLLTSMITLVWVLLTGCTTGNNVSQSEPESGATNQQDYVMKSREFKVDDGLFKGCYHNAFEGIVEHLPDGKVKRGAQGIFRTKGVLCGEGTGFNTMTLDFELAEAPQGPVKLVLNGLDDRFEQKNKVKVELNSDVLADSLTFSNNDISQTNNQRYFIGWQDVTLDIPGGALKKGKNSLSITNQTSAFESTSWNYAMVDYVVFKFSSPVEMTVQQNEYPFFYYGLDKGVELNLWPATNVGNKVCLVKDGDVQFNFFATFPQKLIPKVKGKPVSRIKTKLHVVTDADISITEIQGKPWNRKKEGGKTHFTVEWDMRSIKNATPHPAQGMPCFIQANKAFEGKSLTAWFEIDGMKPLRRTYPLRSVAIAPIKKRKDLDFLFSIWGGGVPKDPVQRKKYIKLITDAGFNHMFTGANNELNKSLKDAGFQVYPRFGWFGHQFKVTDKNKQYAAVSADGKPLTRDFCPLAILAHPKDPAMGRFFIEAGKFAALPSIDGLCVDYECGSVWCWCDKCLALFQKESGIKIKDRSEVAPKGKYQNEYRNFGRRMNRKLLAKISEIMKSVNPKLRYYSLASASDMPAYWWDGRENGRHAISELVKFADEIGASAYFYEVPGGLKSIRPIIRTIKEKALRENRVVDTSIISPIGTTVSELPRYRGVFLRPDYLRLLILLTVTGDGHGLSIFRGDCFDGEHYLASHQAIEELIKLKPYLDSKIDRSFEVVAQPVAGTKPKVDLTIAQNLMSRLEWHPDIAYQYDAVQLFKDNMAKDRVLILFNYSPAPMKLRVKVMGLFDPEFKLTDFKTGKAVGTFSKIQMEGGKVEIEVPARDCRMIRITAE